MHPLPTAAIQRIPTLAQLAAMAAPLRIALAAGCALGSLGAAPEHEAVVDVRVCSTEPAEPSIAFEDAMHEHLSFSRLHVRHDCPKEGSAETPAVFWMRFEESDGKVVLVLETRGAERRTREIPWLRTPERALEETSAASQAPALALLVENLLLEFTAVQLLRAPSMQTAPAALEPAPTWEHSPKPEPAQAPLQLPRTRPPPRATHMSVELSGGASVHTADSIAPLFGATAVARWDRWAGFFGIRAATDSGFSVEGRPFDTSEDSLVFGPRYVLWQSQTLWISLDAYGLLRLSRYRRADLPNTTVKQWLDAGLGCEGQAGVHLSERSSLFARVGALFIPTARNAQIPNGPSRSTGLFRLPLLAGVATTF